MAFEGSRTYITQQSASGTEKTSTTFNREDAKYRFERFIREWTSGSSYIYR